MALALGEDGDEHIGARNLLPARGLYVNDRAMDHALKARGGLRLRLLVDNEIVEIVVEIVDQLAAQEIEVDIAGAHDGRRVAIIDKR
jgi:hypothetical protein